MEIRTIAVIGASALGCALTRRALLGGFRVVLEDFSRASMEQGVVEILKILVDRRTQDGGRGSDKPTSPSSNLSTSLQIEDAIREADLIIETAADEMETKLELFTIFDKFAKPNAIFATTSRIHSVTEIAEITSCPGRCITIWPDPPSAPTTLTVAPGKRTSQETVSICVQVCARLVDSVAVI